MIYEPDNIDLSILAEHFVLLDGCATRKQLLAELIERQNGDDFLVLIDEIDFNIVGFMIAYRYYDNLWINQIWRQADTKLSNALEAMRQATEWAKSRGMTAIIGETKRNEMLALGKYGFVEFSVIIKAKI